MQPANNSSETAKSCSYTGTKWSFRYEFTREGTDAVAKKVTKRKRF